MKKLTCQRVTGERGGGEWGIYAQGEKTVINRMSKKKKKIENYDSVKNV